MKRNLILSILASSFIFLSCSKEEFGGNDPVNTPSKKLVQTSLLQNGTISYHPDGSLKQVSYDQGAYHYDKKFTHTPRKLTYEWFINDNLGENGEYVLVNGKISTFKWTYYDAYGAPIGTFNESYTYNAKGLVDKHIYNNGAYWKYEYDAKDNMILSTYYNENGEATSKSEYEYGTQKDLFPSLGFFTYYGEGFFLPALSKNLPVHAKYTDLLTAQVTYEGGLTYELDANGFVKKGVWTTIVGTGSGYEWNNTFQ